MASAVLMLACGPTPASGDGGAEGTGGSTGAVSSTSTTGPLSTSSSSGSGSESTTRTDDTSGTTTGTETTGDASVCDPQPESIVARLIVDEIEEQYEHAEVDRDLACTIASVTGDTPAVTRILLDCGAEMHTLDLAVEPALELPIEEGLAVQFRMVTFIPWWGDLYVTLRDEAGELLLGFASAGHLFDGCCDVEPDPNVFAPFALSVVSDACELDCDEDAGSGFLVDPCPCTRRKAIDFTTPEDTARVYDRGSGGVLTPTPYDLRVPSAYAVFGPGGSTCDTVDSPLGWHTILIVRSP